jgi:hypothetical protein
VEIWLFVRVFKIQKFNVYFFCRLFQIGCIYFQLQKLGKFRLENINAFVWNFFKRVAILKRVTLFLTALVRVSLLTENCAVFGGNCN